MSNLLSYLWYETIFWTTGPAFTLGFSLRTEGMRHVPPTGPALLIANHQSFLDPDLVGLAARRHLCYLARKTLFRNKMFAWLIDSLQAIPINHEGIGIDGLRDILEQLQAGRAVLVFPEGERTYDGLIHALRPGVALLIKKARAPVVPVGIAGAFEGLVPAQANSDSGATLFACSRRKDRREHQPGPRRPQLAELPRQELLTRLFDELQNCHQKAERLRKRE